MDKKKIDLQIEKQRKYIISSIVAEYFKEKHNAHVYKVVTSKGNIFESIKILMKVDFLSIKDIKSFSCIFASNGYFITNLDDLQINFFENKLIEISFNFYEN